jgi:hypothetical protein
LFPQDAIRQYPMQDQDSLGLRMKTIIKAFAGTKAFPERFPPKTAQPSRVIGPFECFTG